MPRAFLASLPVIVITLGLSAPVEAAGGAKFRSSARPAVSTAPKAAVAPTPTVWRTGYGRYGSGADYSAAAPGYVGGAVVRTALRSPGYAYGEHRGRGYYGYGSYGHGRHFMTDDVGSERTTIVVAPPPSRAARPIQPVSVSAIDPDAIVSRTPSGRVVISGSPYGFVGPADDAPPARPYAPPTFHLIGAPTGRNMQGAVRLTHGQPAPAGMQTSPKVVWLDGSGAGAEPSPHVKHLK